MVARQWKIILICLTFLFVAILFLTHPSEPTYQGRSIDKWIDNYAATPLVNRGYSQTHGYWEALQEAGTNALPYVVRNLARNDTVWHKKYSEWQPRMPSFLKKLIPPPKPLLEPMDGALAFRVFGTNSIPDAIALLKHQSPTVRQAAAIFVASLRSRNTANQGIPPLIELLDDPRLRPNEPAF